MLILLIALIPFDAEFWGDESVVVCARTMTDCTKLTIGVFKVKNVWIIYLVDCTIFTIYDSQVNFFGYFVAALYLGRYFYDILVPKKIKQIYGDKMVEYFYHCNAQDNAT